MAFGVFSTFFLVYTFITLSFFVFNYILFHYTNYLINYPVNSQHNVKTVVKNTSSTPLSSQPILQFSDNNEEYSKHIQGSHRVQVLPKPRTRINPSKLPFCIQTHTSARKNISIPIEILKGSPPFYFDFLLVDINGNTHHWNNISVDSTTVQNSQKHLTTLSTATPGLYKILSFRDVSGEPGSISSASSVNIVECPSAEWVSKPESNSNKCVDDVYSYSLAASGAPPLSVWFERRLQGKQTEEKIEQVLDEENGNDRESINFLKHFKLSRLLDAKLETPGSVLFRILNVTDRFNNVILYTDPQNPQKPKSASLEPINIIQSSSPGDQFDLQVYPRPVANFGADCQYKVLLVGQTNQTSIPVEFSGTPPFALTLAAASSQTEIQAKQWKYLSKFTKLDFNKVLIPIDVDGIYTLLNVEDKFCPGVFEPKYCTIPLVLPPTITVSAQPLEKACVGMVGAMVNISMTGEPPFEVEYDEIVLANDEITEISRTRRREVIEKSRHFMSFQPERPGTYNYQFKKISDKNYAAGVPIEDVSFRQIVQTQPLARLESAQPLIRCIGDSAETSVLLFGRAPWQLTYEIMFNGKKTLKSVLVEKSPVTISSGVLEVSGNYTLSLTDIQSVGECSGSFKDPSELRIEVRAQRPTAAFNCKKPISFLEGGSAELAVSVNGIAPFNLVYAKDDAEENDSKKVQLGNKQHAITVNTAGNYKILSVSDAYCSGIVVSPSGCQAITVPKPTVNIVGGAQPIGSRLFQIHPVCQNIPEAFHIRFTGTPPFVLYYTHEHIEISESGKQIVLKTEHEEKTTQRTIKIAVDTKSPGTHSYKLKSVSDLNYKSPLNLYETVKHTVYATPSAKFTSTAKTITQCLQSTSNTGLEIEFQGMANGSKPPFTLKLEVTHENDPPAPITFTNIESTSHRFVPSTLQAPGKYHVQLLEVSDANGCISIIDRDSTSETKTSIDVVVADLPRVVTHSPRTLCVGDLVSYSLQGVAPFVIHYAFHGVAKVVEVADPLVAFYAAAKGVLEVRRVENAVGCGVDLDGVGNEVWDLPSAFVDGGVDWEEDIREGEESVFRVEFKGVPPFGFTYSRSVLDAEVPEESFTMTNIMEEKYVIRTKQEGLFRVTAVYDKYCGFPRVMQNKALANVILE
ncbi:hypothetical protein HK096_011509 [Nowakowskiella sp. JEL0078]|nr:hypothetical protein HK096_011509 [Nowakowskiella sp. JEL0078]